MEWTHGSFSLRGEGEERGVLRGRQGRRDVGAQRTKCDYISPRPPALDPPFPTQTQMRPYPMTEGEGLVYIDLHSSDDRENRKRDKDYTVETTFI